MHHDHCLTSCRCAWLSLLPLLIVGCGFRAAGSTTPEAAPRPSERCEASALGESPFRDERASRFLVADFRGMTPEVDLARIIANQVADQLTRYKEETLTRQRERRVAGQSEGQHKGHPEEEMVLDIEVPRGSLEIQRLGCWVESHEHAEQVAKALEANVVLWGTAAVAQPSGTTLVINKSQNTVTGNTQGAHSTMEVGKITVETPRPYSVHPRATLWHSERSFRKSTNRSMDLAQIPHLDLPALSQTQPFRLVEFALGLHFLDQASYTLAARFFEKSAESVLAGQANVESLDISLGIAFFHLPDLKRSWKHTRRALERVRGTAREVVCLNNIGAALGSLGDYAGAHLHFRQALEINERALGKRHPHVARELSNIGEVLRVQGDYAGALSHFRRALEIYEHALGKDHPDVAINLSNIGATLRAQGDYTEALVHLRRALEINKHALGEYHPHVAICFNNIGKALIAQGDHAEALVHFRRALEINLRALGEHHPHVAICLNNIGEALIAQGDLALAEALVHFRRALEINLRALGEHHPHVAVGLNNIGEAQQSQGDDAEALLHFQRALEIDLRALGGHHPHVAIRLNNIGEALRAQGDYAAALSHFRRALEIALRALGEHHPDVAGVLNNIGETLHAQGDYATALSHYRRALEIDERVLGRHHVRVASDLNKIGAALHAQRDYAAALVPYRRALKIRKRALGMHHPVVAVDLNNIGLALGALGDKVGAVKHLRRALAIKDAQLGSNHPSTRNTEANLAITLAEVSGWHPNGKPRGAIVLRCMRSTCAGLQTGDWIVSYGATRVRDVQHLLKLTGSSSARTTVRVTVVRAGKRHTLTAPGGRLDVELH